MSEKEVEIKALLIKRIRLEHESAVAHYQEELAKKKLSDAKQKMIFAVQDKILMNDDSTIKRQVVNIRVLQILHMMQQVTLASQILVWI